MIKKFALSIVAFVLISLSVQSVQANEGIVQMRADDGTPGICEIYSMLLDNFQYKMLVNCRGLKYPISQNLFQYALWADHGEEGVTFLGTLGVGKRETIAPKPFNRLFVTKEASRDPSQPSNNSFMSGTVQSSAFLEGSGPELTAPTSAPTQATPTTTNSPSVGNFGDAQTGEQTQGSGLGGAIRILGAVVVFIVIIVIIIAFINASRRRPVSL